MKKEFRKRSVLAALLSAAAAAALILTSCSSKSSSFGITSGLDNTVSINAENSDEDAGGTGSFQANGTEVLVVEAGITSGAIQIRVDLPGAGEGAAAFMEAEYSGKAAEEYPLTAAGEYGVTCQVSKKDTNGTIKMYLKEGEPQTVEESAEAGKEETGGDGGSAGGEENEIAFAAPDEMPAGLQEAARAIDDSLEATWGEERHVSFSPEENTVFIQIWDEGITTEDLAEINNWDEIRNDRVEMCGSFQDILQESGVENGHVCLQYVSDSEQVSLLTVEDGEITYDAMEEGSEEEQLQAGENGGALVMTEEEQKELIAEYIGAAPENLVFQGDGTLGEETPISVYSLVDGEGNEADIRILLFDDGDVAGYTPENELVEVKDMFKEQ